MIVPDEAGAVGAELSFPGSAMLYIERDRKTFRASKDEFRKKLISMEARMEGGRENFLKAVLFVKDKDGALFQSQQICLLQPGKWIRLKAGLDTVSDELVPVNGEGLWNANHAANIFCAGASFFSDQAGTCKIQIRNVRLDGDRPLLPLGILDWEMPGRCGTFEMIESTFKLSREYFNPFDQDEIKVDVRAVGPDGAEIVWPAFYSQDHSRQLVHNREIVAPHGPPEWAFRFTPWTTGEYSIGISVIDNSAGNENPETLKSPTRKLMVERSDRKGFIRICAADTRYFEFATGEFFFPIGFNVHTPKDFRAEQCLDLGSIPDKGSFSYDEYFAEMQKNGVNSFEIWMAAWSAALEWTSAQRNYWGLGRYNLANAWKLDRILASAAENGIYVHLVLDNHGKLSDSVDPEWDDSPHNKARPFASADGAVLDKTWEFFSSAEATRHNRNRNRYVAARWGAFTNVFGIELWSEINLLSGHDKAYADGSSVKWHREEGEYLSGLDIGRHPLTTHFCSDYNLQLQHRLLYELPQISYVVADAYRDDKTPFLDLMKKHSEALKVFKKPVLITEYGGSPHAGSLQKIEADLHAGLWSSFFEEQAGTPFIWWHEFVHTMKRYHHYKGFSMFMQGIDPRGKDFVFKDFDVQEGVPVEMKTDESKDAEPAVSLKPDPENACYVAGNKDEIYGWVCNKKFMIEYPDAKAELKPIAGRFVLLDIPAAGGSYKLSFLDTITGAELSASVVNAKSVPLQIPIPEFTIDVAFKMFRLPGADSVE